MCSGIDPHDNADTLGKFIAQAASGKAEILFTPEMTGLIDRDRSRASQHICFEQDDAVLAAARAGAAKANMWISLGSLAVKSDDLMQEKWINRSFLIDPNGEIKARYDKIHLFDVDLDTGESWRESNAYAGGKRAVLAPFANAKLGLSICYDVRFSALYKALSDAGADILSIPAAFTVPTGKAHWEILLRARAIESASFVVAAAQCGEHQDGRKTFGHSMVVDPWGKILLDMDAEIGVGFCDIDLDEVQEVRKRVPVISNRRDFENPGP